MLSPATSANLGPGFDSLGLALELADRVSAEVVASGTHVEVTGEGARELPRNDSHLVVSTMRTLFDRWSLPQPGLRVTCSNSIPQQRGLGSSAAAICAGVRLAAALVPDVTLSELDALSLGTACEGHPDNVAACLLGGLTIAWLDDGVASAVRLDVASAITPVVFVPPTPLATHRARGALAATVPHRVAADNVARSALLVVALTRRPDLLLPATGDSLHQEARRSMMEPSLRLVDSLRAAGLAAVVSGAGPSVLALCTPPQVAGALRHLPAGWRALRLAVAPRGVHLDV